MRYISTKIAPAFRADIILKQEQISYRFTKNTVEQERYNEIIDQSECDKYLDSQYNVCVQMNENFKIYNFS